MRIVLRGRMDGEAMRVDGAGLTALSTSYQDVVIDMWDVDYIDESGLGAIVYLAKRLRSSGRRVFVTRLTGQPLEYLHKLGCTDLILPDDHPEVHRSTAPGLQLGFGTGAKPAKGHIGIWAAQERVASDLATASDPNGAEAGVS